ncbi:hypothetical protein HDU92_006579 [Lobulomyces angularis]|nr:hypothetical protein HDU92_006579 [Lobulomyces angularis]
MESVIPTPSENSIQEDLAVIKSIINHQSIQQKKNNIEPSLKNIFNLKSNSTTSISVSKNSKQISFFDKDEVRFYKETLLKQNSFQVEAESEDFDSAETVSNSRRSSELYRETEDSETANNSRRNSEYVNDEEYNAEFERLKEFTFGEKSSTVESDFNQENLGDNSSIKSEEYNANLGIEETEQNYFTNGWLNRSNSEVDDSSSQNTKSFSESNSCTSVTKKVSTILSKNQKQTSQQFNQYQCKKNREFNNNYNNTFNYWKDFTKKLFVIAPAIDCRGCESEKLNMKRIIDELSKENVSLRHLLKEEKEKVIDLTNEKDDVLNELEDLSKSLFEEANKMVSEERKLSSELVKTNKELSEKLQRQQALSTLSADAARSVAIRRGSIQGLLPFSRRGSTINASQPPQQQQPAGSRRNSSITTLLPPHLQYQQLPPSRRGSMKPENNHFVDPWNRNSKSSVSGRNISLSDSKNESSSQLLSYKSLLNCSQSSMRI